MTFRSNYSSHFLLLESLRKTLGDVQLLSMPIHVVPKQARWPLFFVAFLKYSKHNYQMEQFVENFKYSFYFDGITWSQSTRGSKIFGNGQKQPYLELYLLKASLEQVIKSTLFCLLILMWSRDRQFKFDPPRSNFGSKKFCKIYQLCMSLVKTNVTQSQIKWVSLLNYPSSSWKY